LPPTCDDWLTFVRPWLSDTLVDAAAYERLRGAARQLPGDGLTALEIRLAPGHAVVDLSWKAGPVRSPADSSFSPRIRQILRRWSAGEWPSVPSLWLEFDLGRTPDGLPEPVLCAEVEPGLDPVHLVDTLLPEMRGAPLETAQRELALRCLGEIRTPARLFYVFDLGPRESPPRKGAIRLELLGLPAEEAPAFFERTAPDLVPSVAAAAPLLAGAERPHLSFDIHPERIEPRIGLEGSFVKWPHREPRWRQLFDRLVDRGLCDPAKREAVFAWPGQETFWSAPARWPAAAAGTRGVCVRALSHVKVVAQPGRAPEAKVYLLFGWVGTRAGF
jgi:hypothetical protein